jgi:ABC-type branched-subunit amino acid transport system substrate-binding protein
MTMLKLRAAQRPALYPALIGLIIGALVAALAFRLSTTTQSSTLTAGSGPGQGSSGSLTPGGNTGPAANASASLAPGSGGTRNVPGGGLPNGSLGTVGPGIGQGSGTSLTATDIGVTPTTIKIGIVLLDLGGASGLGAAVPGFDPKQQQAEWQTWVDDINKRGGINGRKVQAFFAKGDPLDTNSERAACLTLTQDDGVFAVIDMAQGLGTSQLCVTAENKRLLFTGSILPTSFYAQSAGRLITETQHGNRWASDWASALNSLGQLKGRTLGVLTDQSGSDTMVNGGLLPKLKSLGYNVAYVADVSGDPQQGPSEVPAQLQQMRLKNVDAVFLATSFINATTFVSDADKQQWSPRYFVSDIGGLTVGTLLSGMPRSFDGAIAITDYGYDPSPAHPFPRGAASCLSRWNALTGQKLTPPAKGKSDDQTISNVVVYCLALGVVEQSFGKAGPDLTRPAVSVAIQRLGSIDWSGGGPRGHFGPGKFDWQDQVHEMVWGAPDAYSGNCNSNGDRCWRNVGTYLTPA